MRSPAIQSGDKLQHSKWLWVLVLGLLFPSFSVRAAPELTDLSMRGLQIGQPTTLTLRGRGLLPSPEVLLGVPIAKQEVVGKPSDTAVTVRLTLDERAIAGLYNLRVVTPRGVSPSVVVAVDALAQQATAPEVKTLPVALHGKVQGSTVMRTAFVGKRGQQILVEVEAQRLGAKLRPVLHLYDHQRRQLALALPSSTLGGDTRLQATLPADGRYTVEMHDLEYAGSAPGHYRLKLGTFHFADMAYPPAIARGKPTTVQLVGNLPTDKSRDVVASSDVDVLPIPWPEGTTPSGMRPRVQASDIVEHVEESAPAELGEPPLAVSGRLSEAGEEDRYRLAVVPGTRLRFEVFADRLGSPMDPMLTLLGVKENTLASNDDIAMSADPRIDYTVPKGVDVVEVRVSDRLEAGGPRAIYRLVVTSLSAKEKDYRLDLLADSFSVARGGHRLVMFHADRRGYSGSIRLTMNGLPEGVAMDETTIPAGTSGALAMLRGTGTDTGHGLVDVRGESVDVPHPLSRVARFAEHPLATLQPWLSREIVVALTEPPTSDFRVVWNGEAKDSLVLSKPYEARVRLERPAGNVGSVRLSLVSGQRPPLPNGRLDNNRAIRGEKPTIVVAVDPKTKQSKQETVFKVLVPINVDETFCDLALRAELLAKDNKTVEAEAYTSVRRLAVVNPLQVVLTKGSRYSVDIDPKKGATFAIEGRIDRDKVGFAGDVTLTLSGQPSGIPAPRVVVKAGKTDFRLDVKVPANVALGEYANVKLSASGPPDPKAARNVVKLELPLTFLFQRAKE